MKLVIALCDVEEIRTKRKQWEKKLCYVTGIRHVIHGPGVSSSVYIKSPLKIS